MTAILASILLSAMLMNLVKASDDFPNVISITSTCAASGCLSGIDQLTIQGTSLFDDNGEATITLAPNFNSGYNAVVCPIEYGFSTSTLVYCDLPDVPPSYTGIPLMLSVSNALGQTIAGSVMYAPVAPSVVLSGCTQLNSTALDQCKVNDNFFISGPDFPANVSGINIALVDPSSTNVWNCGFFDKAHTTLACAIPSSMDGFDYDWYSVQIQMNNVWSDPITPGIRFAAPSPNIQSVGSNCDPSGCANGVILTVYGTNLLDADNYASVSLAPDFWSNYDPVDCPINFAWSNSQFLFCVLPQVPASYLGVNLMVQASNAYGDAVITGGVTYALPVSSSSTAWQPYPPPPTPSDSSASSSFSIATLLAIIIPSAIFVVLLVVLVLRNRANRRRVLVSGTAAPLIVTNPPAAPATRVNVPVASAPAPTVAPPMYGYHYPQQVPQYHQAQYHQAQYPSVQHPVAQYPSVYHQYPAAGYHPSAPYQPSAPSAYPQVRQYPAY